MFRVWIQDSIEKVSDGIRMIKDGTIKITLAELSGTIASIIIIVTILRAFVNPIEPTEKARTPHREKRNKHKRGKKGRGGRNHHHNGNGGGGGGSGHGKGRIRSGHYRPTKELYDPPSSRSSSPSGRARCESDMEGTTVSTVSDAGIVASSPCVGSSTATNNEQLERNVSSSKNEHLGHDTTSTTSCILDQTNKKSSSPKQRQHPSVGNKKSFGSGIDKKVPSKQPLSSQRQQQTKPNASHLSEAAATKVSGRRSQLSTNGEKQKRGQGKKGKRSKQQQHHQNSPRNSADTPKNNNEVNHFSPSRQVKSHHKARKNHSEDHHQQSRNSNNKAKDFECDTTIGSNVSYSHSDCQNNYSSSSYFSASSQAAATAGSTTILEKEESHPGFVQNRRRSFTDPNSSLPHSYINGSNSNQPLSVATDNTSLVGVPSQMPLMETMTHKDSLKVQGVQEVSRDPKLVSNFSGVNKELFDTNTAPGLYHRHEVGSQPRNQVYSQFDCQRGGFLGDNGSNGSPGLTGLNKSIIRPPPGLVPSQQQNPVSRPSMIAHDLSESSHQSVPYLASSSTSLYSNFSSNSVRNMALNAPQSCNDHFITSSSNNMEYSQRNVTLPAISPLSYNAPAPIGRERDRNMRHSNDEEIEANLLALGGQMAGSILDF